MNNNSIRRCIFYFIIQVLFWGLNSIYIFTVVQVVASYFSSIQLQKLDLRDLTEFVPIDVWITMGVASTLPLLAVVSALLTKSYKKNQCDCYRYYWVLSYQRSLLSWEE